MLSVVTEHPEGHGSVAPPDHVVQFYENEDFLYRVVADYLADGLWAGEPALVIATEAHRQAFGRRLALRGIQVERERAAGRLTFLDCEQTLSKIMVGGMPDWDRFRVEVGGVLERNGQSRSDGRVRAYGEMVDLLWRTGNSQAAIHLEELWNCLGRTRSFSLLCAYSLGNFPKEDDGEQFRQICRAHAHVMPTESYLLHADPEARLREVSILQQRARALESEIERRKKLEVALREALAARQRTEQALLASQEELGRQNQELSRAVRFSEVFVGILGHDLRNPLSAISMAAQVLLRRAESDKVAGPSNRIVKSAQRMGRMIDQLLDFTRIRLGNGIPLVRKRVDLAEVCRLVIDELHHGTAPDRIRLESTGDPTGAWDGDRLAQLISNLLGNALTHGTEMAPIHARLDGTGPVVALEVHNQGALHPQAMVALFQPFHADISKKRERSSGLGLGLYISQQVVLAHAGTIDVSSSDADGTRFIVRLPRDAGAKDAGAWVDQ